MRDEPQVIELNGATIEFHTADALIPAALRAFAGSTPLDVEIDSLSIPRRPMWLAASIRVLRWYRSQLAPHLGQRCVFEPSCSRYAELALRDSGFLRGSIFTIRRLVRCRPGAGGTDLP